MKTLTSLLLLLIVTSSTSIFAQGIGIGTNTPHASAMLDITSSNKGLLMPRVTLANRPSSPTAGLMIYQTDNTPGVYYYNGSTWVMISAGGGLSGSGTNGQISFFNGINSLTSSTHFKWDNTAQRFDVNGINDGTLGGGFTNWISGNFGGSGGNRVVLGVQNGEATIGAHNNGLSGWASLTINPNGVTRIGALTGTGTRMVVANASGEVSTQTIPTGGDNLGNHNATTNINLGTNKLVGNGGSTGLTIANNGNASFDSDISANGFLTVTGPSNLMGSTATAALTVTGAVIAGSLQNYGTTSLIGATTVGTLAGSGTRMVVANATGVLGTQAIPTGGDNLGNHTATQAINLNNNWVSNDGTAKGLRIDNNGSLGVMISSPTGVLDIGKKVTAFTGNFSIDNGQHYANFGSLCSNSCQDAFDGSLGSVAQSFFYLLNVGRYYPAGAVIRRANITINPISGYGHTSISGRLRVMAAMNEADVFTTIVTFTPFTGFGTHTLTFNNLIGYRFYKIEVSDVTTNLGAGSHTWAQEVSFFTETSNTTYNSGGFLVTENGTVGINTNAPTSTLDVNGNVRIRTGAAANSVLIGNANGDASWSNTLPGFKISTTNPGSGTSDWIALNAGGSAGSRLVGGLLNGTPTIGGHNNILSGWTDLAISPGGGNVGIGTSTPSQKLTVNGSADITGSLGIGTNNPLEKLHIIGNAYLTGNIGASGAINCTGNLSTGGTLTVAGQVSFCGGAYTCSDNRYKKDIAPLSQSLQNVLSLNGYTYNWRREEFPNKQFTADKQIGFMAQEIEKMYPEIVYTDPETGYKSVDYSKITPVLVEAIKEQQEQIEQQNARLDAQQQLLNKLIKRLDALEKKKGNKVQP